MYTVTENDLPGPITSTVVVIAQTVSGLTVTATATQSINVTHTQDNLTQPQQPYVYMSYLPMIQR